MADVDYAIAHQIGQKRPIRDLYPGWWVQSFDRDRESFDQVISVSSGTHPATGLPIVQLVMRDHTDPFRGLQLVERADEPVLCLTAKEATRAGLRFNPGGQHG